MKALLAFSGGGGSGFPGAPVAGVYVAATTPEFLAICAQIVAVPYSIVVDVGNGGLTWFADGAQINLQGGSVTETSLLPTPGTVGGVTFAIVPEVAIYNQDSGHFNYFDGTNWIDIGGP